MGMRITTSFPAGGHPELKAKDQASRTRVEERPTRPPEPALDLDMRETLAQLEKLITKFNRRFQFTLDERINRIIVKVIDRETDKVIKEIPPREIQHLLAGLQEMVGMLVDEEI